MFLSLGRPLTQRIGLAGCWVLLMCGVVLPECPPTAYQPEVRQLLVQQLIQNQSASRCQSDQWAALQSGLSQQLPFQFPTNRLAWQSTASECSSYREIRALEAAYYLAQQQAILNSMLYDQVKYQAAFRQQAQLQSSTSLPTVTACQATRSSTPWQSTQAQTPTSGQQNTLFLASSPTSAQGNQPTTSRGNDCQTLQAQRRTRSARGSDAQYNLQTASAGWRFLPGDSSSYLAASPSRASQPAATVSLTAMGTTTSSSLASSGTTATQAGMPSSASGCSPVAGGNASVLPADAPLLAQLGQKIFFDTSLSRPAGQSCASCHAPGAGWTNPDSDVNLQFGPVPGAVPGRFGTRKPSSIAYASFSPRGLRWNSSSLRYSGGLFWDGRAADLTAQAPMPLASAREMNNVLHGTAAPESIVPRIAAGPYARLFQQVFGAQVFSRPAEQVFPLAVEALVAFQSAPAVSPFSSKYDAWLAGKAQLTASELNGLRLFTGSTTGRPGGPAFRNAQCTQCHAIPSNPQTGPDLFTNFSYRNPGVPSNPNNPSATQTSSPSYSSGGTCMSPAFVDFGLGNSLYPSQQPALPAGNVGTGSNGKGDFLRVNGLFKTPTLRNVDTRPTTTFVKAYCHNGVFKSLQQVVHYYNTRNLTTSPGEAIDFTAANPTSCLKGQPLWPAPEVPSPLTLENPTGTLGQIGNLGLTAQEEADLVAFLKTLSDGYFQRDGGPQK